MTTTTPRPGSPITTGGLQTAAGLAQGAALSEDLIEQLKPGNADRHAAFLWQGFHHEWKRRVLGFQTPHRLSRFANYISHERHELSGASLRSEAQARFMFAPGVDGDFAFPEMSYGLVYSPQIRVRHGRVEFKFADDGTSGDHPRAESSKFQEIDINLNSESLGNAALDHYVLLLSGWRLESHCVEARQPAGNPCNSNGMWAHKIFVGIDTQNRVGTSLKCKFHLDIFRSHTPAEGGGKPFNDKLDFDVVIFYTVLGGDHAHFRPSLAPASHLQGDIHTGALTATRTLTGQPGYARAALGMTAFGYELLQTANKPDLGRYMTALTFRMIDARYTAADASMRYDSVMGFKAPDTVHNSTARYSLRPVLLQFDSQARILAGEHSASGEVCFSGAGFSCASSNLVTGRPSLPEQTSDTAVIARQIPVG